MAEMNQTKGTRTMKATIGVPAGCQNWHDWKQKNLAEGYATAWDRKTARLIRRRQRMGITVSAAQLAFAKQVEAIIKAE